jgi:hypothetical protein
MNEQPIRIRRRDDRDRCVETLQIANAKGPGNLDVPALRRLVDMPKEEFSMVMRRVFDAVNAAVRGEQPDAPTRFVNCPRCEEPIEAPAPEIQIERLRRFQLSKPAYWQWSPRELRLLMERLKPGDVVSPTFAHSCSIRRPDGRVVEYMRTAVEGISC